MANVVAEMTLELTDTGDVNIQGTAISNLMVSYGMLEVAKNRIYQYHEEQKKRVQPATAAERLQLVKP